MPKIPAIYCLIFILSACRPTRQPAGTQPNTPTAISSDSSKNMVTPAVSTVHTDAFMENLLASHPELFGDILAHRQDLKVQVIYTQIDRKANNTPVFTPHYFNVDAQSYFYPASTVKMPVALLALEKLNTLRVKGVTAHSPMLTGSAYAGQTAVLNDPTTPDGVPTIAQYIKKIFLVSDNDAFNRLYEFLGQETINQQLAAKGFGSANIYHRLSIPLSEDENRHTNPVWFMDTSGNMLFAQPMATSKLPYVNRMDTVGTAYYNGERLVYGPLDFSRKNRFGLEDMTKVLRAILFPQSLPESERFRINEDDYRFVLKYMSELPSESFSPEYPTQEYWPTYCKFLYYGSDTNAVPDTRRMRIFNKVGDAYGFLTDVAYIVDFDSGIEFMLSATIYCNSDGVLNDDKYDYDDIGYPFMKNLGQMFYEYESKRERKHKPDLSAFRMDYDKR
ncbi:serine hydrolase [Flavihumibacter fluvii]|uniref:serine hydrolase n=1 Tax=Flavihumibacter fluvii TaxID=2838157 RepID=UPI001BDEEC24|nr:serine hydrolase [Flavihumibacter fluvii]ULQ54456.1 class A beta-lactamase-related serine hydrolase [Flavihumibacter fluvii]